MPVNKGYKVPQHIPELFKEIIRHDAARPPPPVSKQNNVLDFEAYRDWWQRMEPWLKRQQELVAAAERALAWNHNKGNTA